MPKNLYDEGMLMVNKGFFSNFSDLVRSGIREEFKELRSVLQDFEERKIYKDKELLKGVKKSNIQAKAGKGKVLKSDKEMDEYFEGL